MKRTESQMIIIKSIVILLSVLIVAYISVESFDKDIKNKQKELVVISKPETNNSDDTINALKTVQNQTINNYILKDIVNKSCTNVEWKTFKLPYEDQIIVQLNAEEKNNNSNKPEKITIEWYIGKGNHAEFLCIEIDNESRDKDYYNAFLKNASSYYISNVVTGLVNLSR